MNFRLRWLGITKRKFSAGIFQRTRRLPLKWGRSRGGKLIAGVRGIVVQKQCTPLSNRFTLLLVYSRDQHSPPPPLFTRVVLYFFVIPFVSIEGTLPSFSCISSISLSLHLFGYSVTSSPPYFSFLHQVNKKHPVYSYSPSLILFF